MERKGKKEKEKEGKRRKGKRNEREGNRKEGNRRDSKGKLCMIKIPQDGDDERKGGWGVYGWWGKRGGR